MTMKLNIKTPKETKSVEVEDEGTVGQLKEAVAKEFNAPLAALCLIYSGKILKDQDKLTDVKLADGVSVHLVIKSSVVNATRAAPSSETLASPTTAAGGAAPNNQMLSNLASMWSNSMGNNNNSNNSTNNAAGGTSQQPALADIRNDFQRQLLGNPEILNSVLDSPIMQGMMSNPDLIRNIVMADPRMQEMMERNPEIGHMLSNPDILRQTMEMARNPSMMQEFIRNQDRAMSNLESIPGGQSALERMFRDVQEPMLDATQNRFGQLNPFQPSTGSADGGSGDGDTTAAGADGARSAGAADQAADEEASMRRQQTGESNAPLPNPWNRSGGSSTTSSGTATSRGGVAGGVGQAGVTGAGGASGGMLASMMNQMTANPEMLSSLMSSPAAQSMMQSMASNPEMMSSMIANNPMLANNPQLRDQVSQSMPDLMGNWQSMQSLVANPEAMSAMTQIQEGLNRLRTAAPDVFTAMTGGGAASPLFAGLNAPGTRGHAAGTEAGSAIPPEQRYRDQLEQLASMGFVDTSANVQALMATFGDVNAAIDRLINNSSRRPAQ